MDEHIDNDTYTSFPGKPVCRLLSLRGKGIFVGIRAARLGDRARLSGMAADSLASILTLLGHLEDISYAYSSPSTGGKDEEEW